jgi:hypothetical protein
MLATLPKRFVDSYRVRGSGEKTRLNDSMADAVDYLLRHGYPGQPLIFVVVTDGEDNQSVVHDPVSVGTYIRRAFSSIPGNYASLIGVGSDINRTALSQIGEYGNFPVVTLDRFEELQSHFDRVVHEVTANIERHIIQGPGFVITRSTPTLHVRRHDCTFALLIDRSGSMAASV